MNRRHLIALIFSSTTSGCVGGLVGGHKSKPKKSVEDQLLTDYFRFPYSSPVLGPHVVTVASQNRGLITIERDTGNQRWQRPISGKLIGSPALNDDTVIVQHQGEDESEKIKIKAFDLESGMGKWTREMEADSAFTPQITNRSVYLRTSKSVHKLDTSEGTTQWSRDGLPDITSVDREIGMDIQPTVSKDTILIPNPNGILAISEANGDKLWEKSIEKVRASPRVDSGTMYATGVSGGVVSVDVESGTTKWKSDFDGCWTTPLIIDGNLYTTSKFHIIALNAETGDEKWRTAEHGFRGDIYSSPIRFNSSVVSGSISLTVAAVKTDEPQTGELEWSVEGGTRMSPTATEDVIYITNADGLHEISLK